MSKSTSVQIPEEAYSAFKKLIEFGPARIQKLSEALRDTGPALDPAGLRALSVCKNLEDVDLSENIETILRDVVFPIRRTMYRHDVSASDMVSGLGEAITQISSSGNAGAGFSLDEAAQWEECESAIADLLDSDTMKMEGKAEALIDARGNRVFGINLYSDLRPLFNEAGEQVKANVLTNTLVIRFNGGGMPRTETFSLDPSSLKDLKEQVDRTLRKNATLAKGGEAQNVRVLVVRSDSDETGDSQ
jgi:hypothetical protein